MWCTASAKLLLPCLFATFAFLLLAATQTDASTHRRMTVTRLVIGSTRPKETNCTASAKRKKPKTTTVPIRSLELPDSVQLNFLNESDQKAHETSPCEGSSRKSCIGRDYPPDEAVVNEPEKPLESVVSRILLILRNDELQGCASLDHTQAPLRTVSHFTDTLEPLTANTRSEPAGVGEETKVTDRPLDDVSDAMDTSNPQGSTVSSTCKHFREGICEDPESERKSITEEEDLPLDPVFPKLAKDNYSQAHSEEQVGDQKVTTSFPDSSTPNTYFDITGFSLLALLSVGLSILFFFGGVYFRTPRNLPVRIYGNVHSRPSNCGVTV